MPRITIQKLLRDFSSKISYIIPERQTIFGWVVLSSSAASRHNLAIQRSAGFKPIALRSF